MTGRDYHFEMARPGIALYWRAGGQWPQESDGAEVLGNLLGVDDLGDAGGTVGYEILTSLKGRYNRNYIGDGNLP